MKLASLVVLITCLLRLRTANSEDEGLAKNGSDGASSLLNLSPDLADLALDMVELQSNLNETVCGRDILKFVDGIKNGDMWAISMADAFGKLHAGIFVGALSWPGSYQQCRNVSWSQLAPFNTGYCWLNMKFIGSRHSQIGQPVTDGLNSSNHLIELIPKHLDLPDLRSGMCVPDSCSGEELQAVAEYIYELLPSQSKNTLKIQTVSCLTGNTHFWNDWKAAISIAVCCVFVLLMAAGTLYDLLLYQTEMDASKMVSGNFSQVKFHSVEDVDNDSDNEPMIEGNHKTLIREPDVGIVCKLLLSFSVYTNGKRILSLKNKDQPIGCISGIRVITFSWIVLGHYYLYDFDLSENPSVMLASIKGFWFKIIPAAHYAVDTFLTISGCLVTYVFLQNYDISNGRTSWIRYYVHRYIRLTPALMLVLLVFRLGLSKYFGSGPFWPAEGFDAQCGFNWWRTLLYIQNFQSWENLNCMSYTWFLALDMQFYIIAPIILICLSRFPVLASLTWATILVSSWVTSGLLAVKYQAELPMDLEHLMVNPHNLNMTLDNIYLKPWCRIGPYLLGMALGWLLYRIKCKANLNKCLVMLGWTLAAACNLGLVFMLHRTHFNATVIALHYAIGRSLWSAGICWVIFACSTGNGGIVNHMLSWPALLPMSRLSYCAYLIHLVLLEVVLYNKEIKTPYMAIYVIIIYIGVSIGSFLAALPISLAFESPPLAMEKLLKKSEKES